MGRWTALQGRSHVCGYIVKALLLCFVTKRQGRGSGSYVDDLVVETVHIKRQLGTNAHEDGEKFCRAQLQHEAEIKLSAAESTAALASWERAHRAHGRNNGVEEPSSWAPECPHWLVSVEAAFETAGAACALDDEALDDADSDWPAKRPRTEGEPAPDTCSLPRPPGLSARDEGSPPQTASRGQADFRAHAAASQQTPSSRCDKYSPRMKPRNSSSTHRGSPPTQPVCSLVQPAQRFSQQLCGAVVRRWKCPPVHAPCIPGWVNSSSWQGRARAG